MMPLLTSLLLLPCPSRTQTSLMLFVLNLYHSSLACPGVTLRCFFSSSVVVWSSSSSSLILSWAVVNLLSRAPNEFFISSFHFISLRGHFLWSNLLLLLDWGFIDYCIYHYFCELGWYVDWNGRLSFRVRDSHVLSWDIKFCVLGFPFSKYSRKMLFSSVRNLGRSKL